MRMVIVCPQQHLVTGEFPFDMVWDNIPLETVGNGFPKWLVDTRVTVWMLSTNIPLPGVIYKEEVPLYPFYWDGPAQPEWTPRYELLISRRRKHGVTHRRWGTQPINTYLRGHICLKPIYGVPDGWARAQDEGDHVLIQQYFKGGWWGRNLDGSPSKQIVIREQLAQNNIGIPLLLKAGFLKPDMNITVWDQSKPIDEIEFGHDPFKLFKAGEWWKYYDWLPTYLREWRPNDFFMPIEQVIEKYVEPNTWKGD